MLILVICIVKWEAKLCTMSTRLSVRMVSCVSIQLVDVYSDHYSDQNRKFMSSSRSVHVAKSRIWRAHIRPNKSFD